MGATVIIKNVDASAVGLGSINPSTHYEAWYVNFSDAFLGAMATTINIVNGAWGYKYSDVNSLIVGKPINSFKAKFYTTGKFAIYKMTQSSDTAYTSLELVEEMTISSIGLQTVKLSTPITLATNQNIVFDVSGLLSGDTTYARFYWSNGGTPEGSPYVAGFTGVIKNNSITAYATTMFLGINIGYIVD